MAKLFCLHDGGELTSHVLLVETFLWTSGLIRCGRPESAAVWRQDFVDQYHLIRRRIEPELEFGVCNDYSTGYGIFVCLRVNQYGEILVLRR